MQGNWVVENGRQIPRIDVGDICSRRPRSIQGWRADVDDNDEFPYCLP
jgi:hypothetical protein